MSTKPQLFGTDGIRGVAGQDPLDRATVWRIGAAIGKTLSLQARGDEVRVVLGEDTRESSVWISRNLASGLRSAGVGTDYAGVLTTPGVAYLTRTGDYPAGVVVSASHNPYQDNGIKVISSAGTKLTEATELEIEQALEETPPPAVAAEEPLEFLPSLREKYLSFLLQLAPTGVSRTTRKLVVDCSNGAASSVIPELVARLGIQTRILNAKPDGRNVNVQCGSLHPEMMAAATRSWGADLGVAFDGDADRSIFSTHTGKVADGDHILFAMAPFLNSRNALKGQAVVGTLMTNLGLELTLGRMGIGLKRTPVGDKYVLEEMLHSGINLGGEPSGHVIFSDVSLAGDGIVTLLEVLRMTTETGKSFDESVEGLKQFPQVIRNVPVREKQPLDGIPEVAHSIRECEREFGGRGRVIVRYSGTERLARVMVEGESAATVAKHTARISEAIEATLGIR
jgi:phosphoglucosamine mutase